MTDEQHEALLAAKLLELRRKQKRLAVVRDELRLWGQRLTRLGHHLDSFQKPNPEDRESLNQVPQLLALIEEHEILCSRVAELTALEREL